MIICAINFFLSSFNKTTYLDYDAIVSQNDDAAVLLRIENYTNDNGKVNTEVNKSLWLLKFDGYEKKLVDSNYINQSPDISYNAKKVLYLSIKKDTNRDGIINKYDNATLFIVDTETGQKQMISSDNYANYSAYFLTDSENIILTVAKEDTDKDGMITNADHHQVLIIDKNGNLIRKITDNDFNYFGCPFRGDKYIRIDKSYKKDNEWRKEIELCNYYGNNKKKIVSVKAYIKTLAHEKDLLVFDKIHDTNKNGNIDQNDNTLIYLVNSDSLKKTFITKDKYDNFAGQMSGNGAIIVYFSRDEDTNHDGEINDFDNPSVFLFDLNNKKTRLIAKASPNLNKAISSSPGGKWIALRQASRDTNNNGEIDHMDNDSIFLMDSKGQNKREIVNDKYFTRKLIWGNRSDDKFIYINDWKAKIKKID